MTEARDQPWFTEDEVEAYAGFLAGPGEGSQRNFRVLIDTVGEGLDATVPDAPLRKLVARAIESTGADRCILMLSDGAALQVRVALDASGRDLGADLVMSRSIPERVVKEGKPISARVAGDGQVLDLTKSAAALKLREVMCAPLRARGKVLGAVYVDSKVTRGARGDAELLLFYAQAGIMGLALENHRLFREAFDAQDVKRQIQTAREIQRRLFPRSPTTYGTTQFAGVNETSARVGGDYFDYLPVDLDRIGIGIGDVAGHGVAPALMMSDLRGHLRSFLLTRRRLDGIYGVLNQVLCSELAEGMFVGLFAGLYDQAKRVLQYQNAGHVAPILYRPRSDETELLEPTAPAMGLFEDLTAGPPHERPVSEGDYLVCYTDGVTDRPDPAGETYGLDRMLRAIRGAARASSDATLVMEAIRADSTAHARGRPLRDDFTLLVVRF